MDYKQKYLKYKNKYLSLKEQIGGFMRKKIVTIINEIPNTYSHIFMPIILAPFENVNVIFNNEIENLLLLASVPTFESLIKRVRDFYVKQNIDLSNFWNLADHGYEFDIPPFHMKDTHQEALLFENGANINELINHTVTAIYFTPEIRHEFIGKEIITEITGNIYN
jgi:hypothetical protein